MRPPLSGKDVQHPYDVNEQPVHSQPGDLPLPRLVGDAMSVVVAHFHTAVKTGR